MSYAIGYVVGGLLGAAFVAFLGNTFAEAAMAILLGGFVVLLLNRRGR